jgi:hypothetical protein
VPWLVPGAAWRGAGIAIDAAAAAAGEGVVAATPAGACAGVNIASSASSTMRPLLSIVFSFSKRTSRPLLWQYQNTKRRTIGC